MNQAITPQWTGESPLETQARAVRGNSIANLSMGVGVQINQ